VAVKERKQTKPNYERFACGYDEDAVAEREAEREAASAARRAAAAGS
jgi:hypothetical protein